MKSNRKRSEKCANQHEGDKYTYSVDFSIASPPPSTYFVAFCNKIIIRAREKTTEKTEFWRKFFESGQRNSELLEGIYFSLCKHELNIIHII